MTVVTHYLALQTKADYHMLDITSQIQTEVISSGLKDGVVTVFVPGSTGALTTVEYEPGLERDIEEFFEKVAPQNKFYHHHNTWHDDNGHSHVRASLVGPSLTIPFIKQNLALGTWQQVVFIDFDVPARTRKLVLQIMGE